MGIVTADFSQFGSRELTEAIRLLTELNDGNRPVEFEYDEVKVQFNTHSGCVFLTNADYEVAMMNGDRLEVFYTSPYTGIEGFWDDLVELYPDMDRDDKEWMRDLSDWNGRDLPELPEEEEEE